MCDAILNGIHKIIGPVCYTQNYNTSILQPLEQNVL